MRRRHHIVKTDTSREDQRMLSQHLWLRLGASLLALAIGAPAIARAAEPTMDKELDKYWNVEQRLPSIMSPMYQRAGRFEGTLHFGIVPNDSYYVFYPVGAKLDFFALDSLAIEAGGSYLLGGNSSLQAFLVCAAQNNKGSCVDLGAGAQAPVHLNMMGTFGLLYSPFHGKLGVFTSKISSFDFALAAGAAFLQADVQEAEKNAGSAVTGSGTNYAGTGFVHPSTAVTGGGLKPIETKMLPGGYFGAGFRYYLNELLALRIDYRHYFFKPGEELPWAFPAEFTVGLNLRSK